MYKVTKNLLRSFTVNQMMFSRKKQALSSKDKSICPAAALIFRADLPKTELKQSMKKISLIRPSKNGFSSIEPANSGLY